MEQIFQSISGLLYWGAIITFFIKGKVKWATLLSLFTFSMYPFMLGLILVYALPDNAIHGKAMAEIPMSLGLILLFLSISSLKASQSISGAPDNKRSKAGWLYIVTGTAVYLLGVIFTLMFFYAPESFGHTSSQPQHGVLANLIFSFISSILLYAASKKGRENSPNFFRKISSLIIFLVSGQFTLVISLILMYSLPISPLTSYPTLAGLNMLCYLFFAAALLLMRREYVTSVQQSGVDMLGNTGSG